MFKKIIVAVDLEHEEGNRKVLDAATSLAKAEGAELRLVYVRFMIERAWEYVPKDVFAAEERETRERLTKLAEQLGLPKDRISVATPIGSVYDQVLSEALEFDADLIVTGPHAPSMAKYLLGGNAGRIVRHAPMSVLVVR